MIRINQSQNQNHRYPPGRLNSRGNYEDDIDNEPLYDPVAPRIDYESTTSTPIPGTRRIAAWLIEGTTFDSRTSFTMGRPMTFLPIMDPKKTAHRKEIGKR